MTCYRVGTPIHLPWRYISEILVQGRYRVDELLALTINSIRMMRSEAIRPGSLGSSMSLLSSTSYESIFKIYHIK
jgi:hypothetical protein